MNKTQHNARRRAAFNAKRIAENKADKSGNHRPRRPVKAKVITDLDIDFAMDYR